jgi:SagB-type dehydrogenase family enzyme
MRSWLAVGILAVIVMSCDSSRPRATVESSATAESSSPIAQASRSLPSPRLSGPASLEEVLAERRSVREFLADPLSDEELGQLLWAAQGVTDAEGRRTAPSAGALYPLELYAVTSAGVYHYDPATHSIATHRTGDHRRGLQTAALGQGSVGEAPVTFVIAAVYERTAVKYGDRAERYVHLEAGHAAQNVLLEAVALGLGAVPIGAFSDERVEALLELPPEERALYLIPVGHPR